MITKNILLKEKEAPKQVPLVLPVELGTIQQNSIRVDYMKVKGLKDLPNI
ncbi:unnamed protein product [marine sediment metagenome]|uniref:Uncharacterized protein n=1 Tax=marine sediment metagenome TaxID=412755 RepID=X1PBC8_9ZZZZ